MDGKAYMSNRLWEAMLSDYTLDEMFIRDRRYKMRCYPIRYDAVFHLVSCADGAPQHYNKENKARHESVEQAIEQDYKT